jgi:thiamine phosphate synthase YjbQ (UPF0047 family)
MTTALAQPAGLLARRQSFVVTSVTRRQANDITRQVRECVLETGVLNGMVLANVLHTTCSVIIADTEGRTLDDFFRFMGRFIDEGCPYRHNDPRWSDCERGNAAAHLRASLLTPRRRRRDHRRRAGPGPAVHSAESHRVRPRASR